MPEPLLQRRSLLQQAAAMAAGVWLPRSAWSQVRWTTDPFALGVASGSPTHNTVVIWTRLVPSGGLGDDAIAVRWELAHDAGFKQLAQTGQTSAAAQLGYSVHVELNGLEPDRWYHYRFMVAEAVSAIGRTRTFPAPGTPAQRLRLAYASCQRWDHGYYSAYRHMLADEPDAVLFLGDYIYEYPGSVNAVRQPTGGWVLTLDDYRARYALHKSDPHLQAMHAACPWLVTWDDHEVQNDYAGLRPGDSGPPVANFAQRRAAAYQAYYENMPLRSSVLTQSLGGMAQGAEMRIYGRVAFGSLATIYLLDDRQYRNPPACTKGGRPGSSTLDPASCSAWHDPLRSFLGAAQEQWLDQAFGKAGPGWNVVGQQTVFGQRDFRSGPQELMSNDGWDGYAPARARFLASMQRQQLANPVFLGGDVHANWVGHVKADYAHPASPAIGVEFCGTSISSNGGSNDRLVAQLQENPHFIYANRERRGYGVVEFTPARLTTTLRAVHDVRQEQSGIETLASFVVEAGRPVIIPG